MAVPVNGGPPRRICSDGCDAVWSSSNKFLYISLQPPSRVSPGKTLVLPIPRGETFPNIPVSGIQSLADGAAFPGSRIIEEWDISPGPDPSTFAYVKTTVHRNLYRVPLPDD